MIVNANFMLKNGTVTSVNVTVETPQKTQHIQRRL